MLYSYFGPYLSYHRHSTASLLSLHYLSHCKPLYFSFPFCSLVILASTAPLSPAYSYPSCSLQVSETEAQPKYTVHTNVANRPLPFSLLPACHWSARKQATPLSQAQASYDWCMMSKVKILLVVARLAWRGERKRFISLVSVNSVSLVSPLGIQRQKAASQRIKTTSKAKTKMTTIVYESLKRV